MPDRLLIYVCILETYSHGIKMFAPEMGLNLKLYDCQLRSVAPNDCFQKYWPQLEPLKNHYQQMPWLHSNMVHQQVKTWQFFLTVRLKTKHIFLTSNAELFIYIATITALHHIIVTVYVDFGMSTSRNEASSTQNLNESLQIKFH